VIGACIKRKTAITRMLLLHGLLGVLNCGGRKEETKTKRRAEPIYFLRKA